MNPIRSALKPRAKIIKKIMIGETDTVKIETPLPYGEEVKMVRQHKLNLRLLTLTEKDEVVEKYKTGMTQTAIADIYGCHPSTVGRLLKQRGVEIRM